MSGHSKWATTKHKKAAIDAKRGKLFANLIKKIEVAARLGGGDPSGNPTLYDAIVKAKKNSVPNDNIDRAVKRGSGAAGETVDYIEITYEAYGPSGVAILIECLTDNRNRSAADVKVAVEQLFDVKVESVNVSDDLQQTWWSVVPGARSGRMSLSARNLFIISGYNGFDPEVNNGGAYVVRFVDLAPFPPTRSFFFSIDLGF